MVFLMVGVTYAVDNPTAQIDRSVINEGETFTLHLTGEEEPDLEVLKKDFQILGTSKNSQVKIINGKMTSSSQRIVTLMPKRTGSLVIPPIAFAGKRTNSITLIVKPARAQSDIGGNKSIFLEVSTDIVESYVQQQIIYSIKLFSAIEMIEASLSPPAITDAVVERLGNDVVYQTTIDGRRYRVTERRYALFPQKSGSLVIPSTLFNGNIADGRQASADPFNRFFQQARSRPMQLKSDEITIEVAPRPHSVTSDSWIPAKELRLTEMWSPDPPGFRVGDPVTRTVRIEVSGLTGAQIPALPVNSSKSMNFYSDQPLVETVNGENTLVGIREEKVALVPKVAGEWVLPEIKIPWWSTKDNIEKMAVIPSRTITVLPAATQVASEITENARVNPSESRAAATVASSQQIVQAKYWIWLSVFLALGWLFTLLVLLKYRSRGLRSVDTENTQDARSYENIKGTLKEVQAACMVNDAAKVRSKILMWAAMVWPDQKIRGLDDVSRKLNNTALSEKFADLNCILYAKQSENWDGDSFWNSVSTDLRTPHKQVIDAGDLPALYP